MTAIPVEYSENCFLAYRLRLTEPMLAMKGENRDSPISLVNPNSLRIDHQTKAAIFALGWELLERQYE